MAFPSHLSDSLSPIYNMFKIAQGEKIRKTVRRHWLVFIGGLIPFAIAAILVHLLQKMLLSGAVWTPLGNAEITAFPEQYVLIATYLLFLVIWLGAMHFVTDYYLDVWIITDQRIIGVLQRGFFSRQVTNFRIERIQDVQTDIHGFFQTIFGIGEVHVQTAGHAHDLIMQTVGAPHHIKQLIMDEVKKRPGSLHNV